MTDAKYDVLGIGNAIFDVLVKTDEGFLAAHGMTKGGMALIDEARAAAIYRDMGPATEMSGGSAANTIVGIASLGEIGRHTSELQSHVNLVCRLLLEKKKKKKMSHLFTIKKKKKYRNK